MLDQGTYLGSLVEAQSTQSQNGTPQVRLVFAISAIQQGNDFNTITATERSVYIFLSDKAWPTSQKKLQSLEFNGDFGEGMNFGRTENIMLTCSHEEYQGKQRERWELTNWGTQERKNLPKPAGKVVQELNAKWKIKAGAVTLPPAVAPRQSPVATPATKPTAAPAAKKGPPPVKGAATATRDEAWAACAAHMEGVSDDAQAQHWQDLLSNLFGPNYDEATLTSADWGRVKASAASIIGF